MPPKASPDVFGTAGFRWDRIHDGITFGAGLWQWWENDCWWDMHDTMNVALERAIELANPTYTCTAGSGRNTSWEYHFDLVNYIQKNLATGTKRPIRRIELKAPIILP